MSARKARQLRRERRVLDFMAPGGPAPVETTIPLSDLRPWPGQEAQADGSVNKEHFNQAKGVPIEVWQPPAGMSEEEQLLSVLLTRIATNLRETGHPFHHKTASGVIVDDDPSTRHLIREAEKMAAPATKCDYTWYGFDPYPTEHK